MPDAPPRSLAEAFFASSGVWRLRVGRSGSSAGAGLLLESVDEGAVVLSRRFMGGRSGSSAGGEEGLVCVDDAGVAVLSVPEVAVVLSRRFMVGRSGSSAGVEV